MSDSYRENERARGGERELEKNRGPEVMRTRIRERERKREEIVWCT